MQERFIIVIANYTNFTVYDFLFMFECLFTFSTTLREGKVIRHSAIMHSNYKLCSVCRTFLNRTPYLLCLFNSPSDDLNFFCEEKTQ
jgi:hypothetical protein